MTRIIEIPPEQWPTFVRMLSELVDGRQVRLEVARRELGDQEMSQALPLIDIDLEEKGSDAGQLIVSVGSDRGRLMHVVGKPTRLALGVSDLDELQFLAIAEAEHGTTVIHFEHLPEVPRDYGATP